MNRLSLPLCLLALFLTACTAVGARPSTAPATNTRITGEAVPSAAASPAVSPPVRPLVRPSASPSACASRRAWAAEVSAAGQVIWRVRLPTDPSNSQAGVPPVVIGDAAVFAESDGVYALRRADGHRLWRLTFPPPKTAPLGDMVYDLWPWRGTVVALVGRPSGDARLMALDSASGSVRWTLRLPHDVLGIQAITADGVLAILAPDGVLSGADLTTGQLIWSRRNGPSTGPLAFGTVVVAGSNGRAIGYDGRTGRVLWTARGLPGDTVLTAADGLALVQDEDMGAGQTTAVTALVPRTGRVAWRFDPGTYPSIQGAGVPGIVISADRVYLVSQVTGRARWAVDADTPVSELTPPLPVDIVSAGSVVGVEGRGVPSMVGRRAADGKVLWSVPLPGYDDSTLQVAPAAGPYAVLTMGPADGGLVSRLWGFRLGSGAQAGSTALPTLVQSPLTAVPGGVLVQLDDPECGTPVAARSAAATAMS